MHTFAHMHTHTRTPHPFIWHSRSLFLPICYLQSQNISAIFVPVRMRWSVNSKLRHLPSSEDQNFSDNLRSDDKSDVAQASSTSTSPHRRRHVTASPGRRRDVKKATASKFFDPILRQVDACKRRHFCSEGFFGLRFNEDFKVGMF